MKSSFWRRLDLQNAFGLKFRPSTIVGVFVVVGCRLVVFLGPVDVDKNVEREHKSNGNRSRMF